jgi:diadenosine tetraphosphate (Ap4A) HIT family hydrolase
VSCDTCTALGPGGVIFETDLWHVDHTFGSLGVGTLIVRPKRHVVHVGDLTGAESAELGPLLQRTAAVVAELARPSQVYVCLWSHMNREPGHIHFVVQPVSKELMDEYDLHGPALQTAIFARAEPPDDEAAEAFAAAARRRMTTP